MSVKSIETDAVQLPSDRSFGLTAAVFFAIISLYPRFLYSQPVRFWALLLSAVLVILAVIKPGLLNRANVLWCLTGNVLQRVANPIMLAVFFYGVLCPFGIIATRVFRKVPLELSYDKQAESYWIRRVGQETSGLENQF